MTDTATTRWACVVHDDTTGFHVALHPTPERAGEAMLARVRRLLKPSVALPETYEANTLWRALHEAGGPDGTGIWGTAVVPVEV